MAKINNSGVIQKLIDELELYPAKDTIPSELAEKILPVFQVNSEQLTISATPINVIEEGGMSDSSADTLNKIYDVPATGKFYLTDVHLCMSFISTTGITDAWIEVTIGGVVKKICLMKRRSTATYNPNPTNVTRMNFNNPILLDKGTDINLKRTTADKGVVDGEIMGYTE